MLDSIKRKGRRAIYVAEIGLNHNGSVDTARALIEAAARAGADAVKFQVFVPELMVSPRAEELLSQGSGRGGAVEFFRKFVLGDGELRELKAAAEAEDLAFFSSVFDVDSLDLLESMGVDLYKLASSEVTNHPLISAVARTGKPLVLSTGISSEEEIDLAVSLFRGASGAELVLMHCVSLYPTGAGDANLARIPALARRFGLQVGFSDHTREAAAPMLASALGARIFERHFTIDRFHDCPDKEISSTPEEFSAMMQAVESAIEMVGDGAITSGSAEAGVARAARRSLFARTGIPKGKPVEEGELVALRPGVGIPPHMMGSVIGRTARVEIPAGGLITIEDLD
ncbi:MAG: N-acetylneuraminate synthase [Chrysiogenales bacterium]|nr:MAG: N-acetylneuraminate synthase [Chrysiogenales bacterium]